METVFALDILQLWDQFRISCDVDDVARFVSECELLKRLDRGIVNEMKLRTGLIRVSRWKLAKEPMQLYSGEQ